MSEKIPYPKYQECPCGSRQKYKFCCFLKGFHYYIDENEELQKTVPLAPEIVEILKRPKLDQEKKLGRPVGPGDLIFPELAALSEEDVQAQMVTGLRDAGASPVVIYAFEKTGLLVTDANKHLIADIDLEAWTAAVEEYYVAHPEDDLRTT